MVSKHQYIYIYILKLKHIKPTKASNINKGLITLLGQKQGTLIVFQKKKKTSTKKDKNKGNYLDLGIV